MTLIAAAPYVLDVLPSSADDLIASDLPMREPRAIEPAVGEIRALRTFRISSDGRLCSLSDAHAWTAGTNTARCRYSRGPSAHAAPDLDCSCGLHACSTAEAVQQFRPADRVLAVVACWGHVVVDADDIRAEHARIEAVWLSKRTSGHLLASLHTQYPQVPTYRSRAEMLAVHSPTVLDAGRSLPVRTSGFFRAPLVAAALAGLVLGCLPGGWILHRAPVLTVWSIELGLLAGVALLRGIRPRTGPERPGWPFVVLALICWLVSPLTGPIGGWLFRAPLAEIVVLSAWHRLRAVTIRVT